MVKNHSIVASIGAENTAWVMEGSDPVPDTVLGRGPVARFDNASRWVQELQLTPGNVKEKEKEKEKKKKELELSARQGWIQRKVERP